eukprot:c27581_g1_i1 orf=432-1508(-)
MEKVVGDGLNHGLGSSREAAMRRADISRDGNGDAKFLIFMSGKSSTETESTKDLIGRELKLSNGSAIKLAIQSHDDAAQNGSFQGKLYLERLETVQFGRLLLWSPHLPSTQTFLSENFRAFALGTVCIADVQFQGKGRAGNSWASPLGCLMFSFTLQMENGRMVPFLQYVVTLAMIEAIANVSSEKDFPSLEVKIKWPNDLYANGLKIGGVLCTSTYSANKFNIVVGVGLNVGNSNPTTCLDALLQELVGGTSSFRKEELLASFFGKFEELFNIFINQGFSALEASYYQNWLHSGQNVELEEKLEEGAPVSKVSLTIKGLSPTGYLLAIDDHFEKYELHPDGNSFDLMRGLLRTKLPS